MPSMKVRVLSPSGALEVRIREVGRTRLASTVVAWFLLAEVEESLGRELSWVERTSRREGPWLPV
jgi:hypothetical protein